jgi:hypothetical protein
VVSGEDTLLGALYAVRSTGELVDSGFVTPEGDPIYVPEADVIRSRR